MTPKEKATELIEKYVDIQSELEETTNYYWGYAKKCALIAVEELMHAFSQFATDNQFYYWQEVKSEIEKL